MAELRIPERYRPGISLLANIPDSSYQEVLDAVKRAPPHFSSNRELAAWIASEVTSITAADVPKIIDSLSSLYRVRARNGVTPQKLAGDVLTAARDGSWFKVSEGVDFENRLAALLALDSLNLIAVKAKELQLESERTFCSARIITDVRPIFGEKATEPPSAMFVVHTLNIGFHDTESPSHKEFFVALDADDIVALKRALQRAEEKEISLKAALAAGGLRTIDHV